MEYALAASFLSNLSLLLSLSLHTRPSTRKVPPTVERIFRLDSSKVLLVFLGSFVLDRFYYSVWIDFLGIIVLIGCLEG